MPARSANQTLLFKKIGQFNESRRFYHWIPGQPHARTDTGIKHPCGHTPGGSVGKPHIHHVPLTARRTKGLAVLPEEWMKRIEDL